jgi:hypothetical protein
VAQLRYFPSTSLEGLRKATNNLRISYVSDKVGTEYLRGKTLFYHRYTELFGEILFVLF